MNPKESIARNYVECQTAIAQNTIANSLSPTKTAMEKTLRDCYIEKLTQWNTLRLMYLTGNMNEADYRTRMQLISAEVANLEKYLWPNRI